MAGWNEDNLLKFMQVHSEFSGGGIKHIHSADKEWICKTFTDRLFALLDWTQVYETPYVDITFCGKGDIESIKVKNDFCLSITQCVEIANFIAARTKELKTNELLTFAILQYIQYGIYIRTDYFKILKKTVMQSLKGGE